MFPRGQHQANFAIYKPPKLGFKQKIHDDNGPLRPLDHHSLWKRIYFDDLSWFNNHRLGMDRNSDTIGFLSARDGQHPMVCVSHTFNQSHQCVLQCLLSRHRVASLEQKFGLLSLHRSFHHHPCLFHQSCRSICFLVCWVFHPICMWLLCDVWWCSQT